MEINGTIKIHALVSECPRCGKKSGSDLASFPLDKDSIQRDVEFWCNKCGIWTESLDIKCFLTPQVYEEEKIDDYDLESCEECGELAWDGYICHVCGMKKI